MKSLNSTQKKYSNKCIVILGMHRSGTSALTRVINLLGVNLGNDLFPAKPHNPLGLWEHRDIMETHESIFEVLGNSWLDFLTPLPPNWWQSDKIKPYQDKLLRIVKEDFSQSPFWGLKDPRLCRLLPLWLPVFTKFSCQPYFLHIVRNPIEVAASLKKRNGLSQNVSFLLWMQHLLEAEKSTRGYHRVFITFDQLIKDWQGTMSKVADSLNITWPNNSADVQNDVNTFLSPDLKHYNSSDNLAESRPDMNPKVAKVYKTLLEATKNKNCQPTDSLKDIYESWEKGLENDYAKMLMEDLIFYRQKQVMLNYQLKESRDKQAHLNARINKISQSLSWRITKPLRSDFLCRIFNYF